MLSLVLDTLQATYADGKMTVQDAVARGHMHLDQVRCSVEMRCCPRD